MKCQNYNLVGTTHRQYRDRAISNDLKLGLREMNWVDHRGRHSSLDAEWAGEGMKLLFGVQLTRYGGCQHHGVCLHMCMIRTC